MNTSEIARMSRYEILDALIEGGFRIDPADAAEVSETIQMAARAGALVWTPDSIVSTLRNRPLVLHRVAEPRRSTTFQRKEVRVMEAPTFINVWNCRAAVSRFVPQSDGSLRLEAAANWQDLEDEAITAVREQGGGINISGHYYCPPELVRRARWQQ